MNRPLRSADPSRASTRRPPAYRLSPRLVGRIGLRRKQDELSLGYLVDLVEEVQVDIAALDRTAPELPSLGVEEESPESTIVSLSRSPFDREEAMTGTSIRGVLHTF
ncbi:hypothetical protein ACVGVM_08295 [Pseudonocardia bannensis]|uniref:hypothetical protein n=1 Tax=Pseudonocardia bannensis TaxID=630973 RepID=UPI003F68A938